MGALSQGVWYINLAPNIFQEFKVAFQKTSIFVTFHFDIMSNL